ncbi:MAG: cell division topological specificity factor MinE [Clostridia bacterium]
MFENVINFFKKIGRKDQIEEKSKDTAKERLHLVLMQDRANVSADFLDMMRQEIIEVIKKYIDVDEKDIDVRLTNKTNEDGTMGAPALYANIPITGIKENMKKEKETEEKQKEKEEKEIKETKEGKNEKEIEKVTENTQNNKETEQPTDIEPNETEKENNELDSVEESKPDVNTKKTEKAVDEKPKVKKQTQKKKSKKE